MSLLFKKYKKEVVPSLLKDLGLKNVMQVPKLKSITLNMCLSEAVRNPKVLDLAAEQLTAIAGQKAVLTKAKKAIANFKLREGMPLGVRVTLRKEHMWNFLEKLVHFSIPKSKDFRGLSRKAFDGRGNYNMGVIEHIIFSEVDYDKIDKVRGFNISMSTTATNDQEGLALLEALGMPFKKK